MIQSPTVQLPSARMKYLERNKCGMQNKRMLGTADSFK